MVFVLLSALFLKVRCFPLWHSTLDYIPLTITKFGPSGISNGFEEKIFVFSLLKVNLEGTNHSRILAGLDSIKDYI